MKLPKILYDAAAFGGPRSTGFVKILNLNGRSSYKSSYLVNQNLIDEALVKSNLLKEYNSEKMTILEMAPGPGVTTTSLFNYFQPKSHVVLESREVFSKPLQKLCTLSDGRIRWVHQDGYYWQTYEDVYVSKVLNPRIQTEEEQKLSPHRELLFFAHLPHGYAGLLFVSQILDFLSARDWLGIFGRVRVLLWLPCSPTVTLLGSRGFSKRSKTSVFREAFTDSRVLAASESTLQKLCMGYSKEAKENYQISPNPLLISPTPITSEPHKEDLTLVEMCSKPQDKQLSIPVFESIVRILLTCKATSLSKSIYYLGPGAETLLPSFTQCGINIDMPVGLLSAADFLTISKIIQKYPFKHHLHLGTIIEDS